MKQIKKIADILKAGESFLITAHDSPCGDAIASGLALGSILRRIGKKVLIYNSEPVPESLLFLPGSRAIRTYPAPKTLPGIAVVLDCANPERIGKHSSILKNFDTVLNIDHHISNTRFGALNYVDPGAASTGEQIYKLSRHLVGEINRSEAICLYTTIVMDTGFFKYSNTTSKTHDMASFFLRKGVDPAFIAEEINGGLSAANRKLLGSALSNMKTAANGKIVYMKITRSMISKCGAGDDEAQDFIDYIQPVKDSAVSFCTRELPKNVVKVNFRSKGMDVNRIASEFGGGGHKRASGCTLTGLGADEAEKMVLKVLKRFLGK